MEVRVYNESGDRELAFVLGWGNRPDHDNVQWLIEHLTGAGYRVHAFEIPVNVSNFRAEYVDPVAGYVADLGEYRLLGHSAGGLIGPFVDSPAPETQVYLSPWWGYTDEQTGLLFSLVTKLPTGRRFVPAGTDSRAALGELATDRQIEDNPAKASPAFLRETREAQRDLPPVEGAVVFYTRDDQVVSPAAIERLVPAGDRVAYDGAHELFSSRVREEYVDDVLAALDRGPEAV